MARSPPEWTDLHILLVLAREGSMVAAARELGVEHSTVSRRIGALERDLGARLMTRGRSGVALTDAGREALHAAEDMERAVERLAGAIARSGDVPEGRVKVSMTDSFVALVTPLLTALGAMHAGIEVELMGTSTMVNLTKGEADIALRFARPTEPSLVAVKILDAGWSLYASEAYVAARGPVESVDALQGHDVVGFDDTLAGTKAARWLAEKERGARVVSRASSTTVLASMVSAGLGMGVLPCYMADALPLVRLTRQVLAVSELYAVTAEEKRDVPRVRVVMDFLVGRLKAEAGRFAGR